MEKRPLLIRVMGILLAFVLIVMAILFLSSGSDFKGKDDILYVQTGKTVYKDEATIERFCGWLIDTFGESDICFVKRDIKYIDENCEWSIEAARKTKGMSLDDAEFEMPVYFIYVYLKDGRLYLNGAEYETDTIFETEEQ